MKRTAASIHCGFPIPTNRSAEHCSASRPTIATRSNAPRSVKGFNAPAFRLILTPALSFGERENRSSAVGDSESRARSSTIYSKVEPAAPAGRAFDYLPGTSCYPLSMNRSQRNGDKAILISVVPNRLSYLKWFLATIRVHLWRSKLPMNLSTSSPRPSPPFRMEERVAEGRERRRCEVQGHRARNGVRRILSLRERVWVRGNSRLQWRKRETNARTSQSFDSAGKTRVHIFGL